MKNKYFILVFTFFCLLVGQSSYSQDWDDFDDDFGWDDFSNDDSGWYGDEDFTGPEWNGGVVVYNDYHAPDYSEYLNADLYDPYNYGYQSPPEEDEQQEDPPVRTPTTPTTPATPDPEVCSLVVCTEPGATVDRNKCECVAPQKPWYLDDDGDDYYASYKFASEKPSGNYKDSGIGLDCDDNDASKNEGSECGYKMWYLDWDGDGYHSDQTEELNSPGVGWILTTKGVDCDEMDPDKNYYCGDKMWYTDNDNDGWYADLKGAPYNPGSGWIEYTAKPPKGQDCDDTKSSANNICAPLDDCAEIKKLLANQKYRDMLAKLEDPNTLSLHYETGYWQDKNGNYNEMIANGERAVAMPDDISTMENFNHVHMNDWKDLITGELHSSYPMPSPADIAKLYGVNYNSRSNGLNLSNTYVGNTSYLGSFQMRYVGSPDNLSAVNFNKIYDTIVSDESEAAYILAMEQNPGVAGLLTFLKDALKTSDIALYKIEATGASKIELDANNKIKITPCN